MSQRILIISHSELHRDPRVKRQIRTLAPLYDVTTVGLSDSGVPGVEHIALDPPKRSSRIGKVVKLLRYLFRRYERIYWGAYGFRNLVNLFAVRRFDLVLANDVEALPFAVAVRNGARLIWDAHEYAPRQFEDRFVWNLLNRKLVEHICFRYAPQVDCMFTVCDGIAAEYERIFGVHPIVMTNAAPYAALEPVANRDGVIRLIHHGGATRSRHLELMIDAMKLVPPEYTLTLMLMPTDSACLQELRDRAASMGNVEFVEPVTMENIVGYLNRFDAGAYLLPPANFNSLHALPNKIFEFIQARLACVIGPSLAMQSIVEQFGVGVVSEDFTPASFAVAIRSLTVESVARYKAQAHLHAAELSEEKNTALLLREVERELKDDRNDE